jgi:porphobilinogen synthase
VVFWALDYGLEVLNMDMDMDMVVRPRRLRGSQVLRKMVRETRVDKAALVYPMFVVEGVNVKEEIVAMPGQFRYSVDRLEERLVRLLDAGVSSVMLFGVPERKDQWGSGAFAEDGVVQRGLRRAKEICPELFLIGDVCLCEYTSHGHCGVLRGERIDNDGTLDLLVKTAVALVRAGADMVAPSDMMDGRVAAIRRGLDREGFEATPIMSYAVKFASAFYGPFREAAGSAPAFGDRKSYQMDFHNAREALKEALLDVSEGADILMVKPALAYGDLIWRVKNAVHLPVAAYSVSGEYAMVRAAAQLGVMDERETMCEMAMGAFRAGTDIYISYFAEELARCMDEGRIG